MPFLMFYGWLEYLRELSEWIRTLTMIVRAPMVHYHYGRLPDTPKNWRLSTARKRLTITVHRRTGRHLHVVS